MLVKVDSILSSYLCKSNTYLLQWILACGYKIILKGSILYYYRHSARNILDVIFYKFWPSNLLGTEVEGSLNRYYRIYLIGMMSIYSNAFLFSIAFCLTPIFKQVRETPYKTVYPFDYNSSPQFEIIYIIQSFTNFYIIIGVVIGIDTFFMAICFNITAQYRLLKNIFLKFGTDQMKEINAKLISQYAESSSEINDEKKFLIGCVNHHQLLLRTVEDIERVFNLIGSLQLGFSTIAICLSSFVLSRENVGFDQLINIFIFMTGSIVQLFCYCSVATEMDFEMNNLPQYIFSSYWYETDFVKLKKDIIFTMKKSQEVKKFTVLKLIPLNYDTFIQVLRISFSFHTLLSNITVK